MQTVTHGQPGRWRRALLGGLLLALGLCQAGSALDLRPPGGITSVALGGTGASTLTGVVLGNGTSAMTATALSAGVAGALSDESGTGSLIFSDDASMKRLSVGADASGYALTVTAAGNANIAKFIGRASGNLGFLIFFENNGTTPTGAIETAPGHIALQGPNLATVLQINTGSMALTGTMFAATLTAAAGTPSSICKNAATHEVTVNPALTCTVSARDQKAQIVPYPAVALDVLAQLTPTQFTYIDDPGRLRWGFIADELQAVSPLLADGYDAQGQARSIDQNALLATLVQAVQAQQRQLQDLRARLAQLDGR